jgi:hypothetical protein
VAARVSNRCTAAELAADLRACAQFHCWISLFAREEVIFVLSFLLLFFDQAISPLALLSLVVVESPSRDVTGQNRE